MFEFLKFFDKLVRRFPLHLEITYNKHTDYIIEIFKKGCAKDYPNAPVKRGEDVVLVSETDLNIEVCFARAYVALIDWMLEYNDGY